MKNYTIREHRYFVQGSRKHDFSGTLEELIKMFAYTLEVGKSWESERGNKKISLKPRTIRSLVTNLNNAVNNAAANGYSNTSYWLVEE